MSPRLCSHPVQIQITCHIKHNLKQKSTSLPYEFRALESILVSVVSALEAEMVFTRHLVGGLLAELEDDIDRDKFKRLLHYSRRLQSFMNRAKLVQSALEEVLQQGKQPRPVVASFCRVVLTAR